MRGEHARVALYGTDAVAEPCRVLRAGPSTRSWGRAICATYALAASS